MLSELVKALLADFAESTIEGIKTNIRTKSVTSFGAMNASGKMAESLKYRIDNEGLTIFSTEQFFTVLETGRKPGKRPPIAVVEQWIKDKPVGSDINPKSLAFLIARKIGEEGSLLYRQGGNSGVISDFINQKNIEDNLISVLNKDFKEYIINEFINKINNGSN